MYPKLDGYNYAMQTLKTNKHFTPTEAETYANTKLNFDHKLLDWSAESGLMTFIR